MTAETYHHDPGTSLPPRQRLRVIYQRAGERWGFSWTLGEERLLINRIDELRQSTSSGLGPIDAAAICRNIVHQSRAVLDADKSPPDGAA